MRPILIVLAAFIASRRELRTLSVVGGVEQTSPGPDAAGPFLDRNQIEAAFSVHAGVRFGAANCRRLGAGWEWATRMDRFIDTLIGRQLRRRRKFLNLTQREVATACGVRFQQIQKYECGLNRMSAATIWRLADVLQAPVSYFFDPVDALRGRPEAANQQEVFEAAPLETAHQPRRKKAS